jgi:hypothetical protein
MTESNGTPERAAKIVTLKRAGAFVVSKWLRKHAEEIRSKKLTIEQVGELAGKQNGFGTLTPTNMRSICKDFGIDPVWVPHGNGGGRVAKGKASGTSKYIARQILAVSAELDRLYRELNEKFNPDGVVDLPGLRLIARGELPDSAKTPESPADPSEPVKPGTVRTVQ